MYSPAFLSTPDTLEHVVQPFPTAGDRFAASELRKRSLPQFFDRKGFMLQAFAAWWHYKSAADLLALAEKVGRRRIMVVHGTADKTLSFPHGVVLWRGLENGGGRTGKENWLGWEDEKDVWVEGEVEKRFVKGQGHVIPIEMREEFHGWMEGLIKRGKDLNEKEGVAE